MSDNHRKKVTAALRRFLDPGAIAADSDLTGQTYWIDPESGRPRSTPASEQSRQDRYADVFIEMVDAKAVRSLRKHEGVSRFVQVVDGYCTARVRLDLLDSLAARKGVTEIEKLCLLRPQLDHSVVSIHGWPEVRRGGRNVVQQDLKEGTGVVIGIVDYGLDYTLDDFLDLAARKQPATRIEYLWDQELAPEAGEKAPGKYGYGVEYSKKQINAALEAQRDGGDPFSIVRHDPLKSDNEINFHGTHVTGIAAGNGKTGDREFHAGTFVGVAPGAKIVFVNLDRQAILRHVRSPRGTLSNSIQLAHAIAYCFEKAEQLNMPCVVNLSMGFNGGGHDGNSVVEWIIDTLLRKPGRAMVGVAGNEYRPRKNIYLGDAARPGTPSKLVWVNGLVVPLPGGGVSSMRDKSPNEMEIWYSSTSRLRARLVSPQPDDASPWVSPDVPASAHPFSGGESVIITSDQNTPWGGDAMIHIYLAPGTTESSIRPGNWTVELEVEHVGSGERNGGEVRWDAWIERSIPEDTSPQHERSRFRDFDPSTAITLTTPGTGRSVISVASCNSNDPSQASDIAEYSGQGPTRDGRRKPEVAAPGETITSSNAGAGRGNPARVKLSGTSMAAPHVTGIVARLLSRHNYLTWREIRDILTESAKAPAGFAPHDLRWGFGKVDVVAAMKNLEGRLR